MNPTIVEKKVLIVEDEAPLRNALSDGLQAGGFTVFSAKNGQEGLDYALKEKPQVIILDLMMPVMDGMTVLKKLREDAEYGAKVQIIVISNIGIFDERVTKGVNTADPAFYLVKSNWSMDGVLSKVNALFAKIEMESRGK